MTNHIEFLVEELSCERVLRLIIPRILPEVSFEVRTFGGKQDLLKNLPQRLTGYSSWVRSSGTKIVIVVDRDDEDCVLLKRRLESMAHGVGLSTRSSVPGGQDFDVLNRIAVEELESWFFGDVPALRNVYPRLPASLASRATYRNPDRITNTWEALQRVLNQYGYHSGGLRKVNNAELMGAVMNVDENSSHSFCEFRDGVRRIARRTKEA